MSKTGRRKLGMLRTPFRSGAMLPVTRWKAGLQQFKVLFVALIVSLVGLSLLMAQEQVSPCQDSEIFLVAEQLAGIPETQLVRVLDYTHLITNTEVTLEALGAATQIAHRINDVRLFPKHPMQKRGFLCLQRELLSFYEEVVRAKAEGIDLQHQDLLARASLRIHHSMIDDTIPISKGLAMVLASLADYRSVFQSARQLALAAPAPRDEELPIPDFEDLVSFVELSLENSFRFPKLLGEPFGETLAPVLCDAYETYPEGRAYIAYHYNILVRFDGNNLGASEPLYHFMNGLADLFWPARGLPSFLHLSPSDWSTSSPPCAKEDWQLTFPEFVIQPGFRFPEKEGLEEALDELESLLARSAEFKKNSIHLWKPFRQYGVLLYRLAQSLKVSASRNREMNETRHMLMAKARDAFLLGPVNPDKHPLEPDVLQELISQQIREYGKELMSNLEFEYLIDFAEDYLEVGQVMLTDRQKQQLHRYLAIVHAVQGDEPQSLTHLEESDIELPQLERIREQFQAMGVGVQLQPISEARK